MHKVVFKSQLKSALKRNENLYALCINLGYKCTGYSINKDGYIQASKQDYKMNKMYNEKI